jgi:hypothetical protein
MSIHARDPIKALKAFLAKARNPSAARRAAKALAPHIMEIRSRLVRAHRGGHRVNLCQPLDRLLFGS